MCTWFIWVGETQVNELNHFSVCLQKTKVSINYVSKLNDLIDEDQIQLSCDVNNQRRFTSLLAFSSYKELEKIKAPGHI